MRGTDCNTDHRMLWAKLVVGRRRYFRRCSGGADAKRWIVSGLMGRSVDEELAAEKVRKKRLEWLGHVARMPYHRLPKSLLFGCLP